MNFEAVIGIEIHAEMKTKSKMFSSSPVRFGDEPNTNVSPFDMAFPGSMPSVNKQAVINAIRMCHALNMKIDDELWFDRKNYFYSDLPKGYQITQQKRPLGLDGYIDINTSNGKKRIGIEQLHLEEDTCQQHHLANCTLLDYNRAGIPLIEIVSKPVLKTGEEAMKYAEKIHSIIYFLGISNGKMEEGAFRCDVNVSIMPIGAKHFGTKVEIKNINSFADIQRAIDFEIQRQERILLSGGIVEQETRRYDEAKKETVLMRIKTDEIDYKLFTEPNIAPIKLSKEFIEDAINTSPELAETKQERYKELGLNDYDSGLLTMNKEISEYYDEVIKQGANPKLAANWVLVDIQSILNKKNISIEEFTISPKHLSQLIKLIERQEISNKQARDVFIKMQQGNQSAVDIIKGTDTSLINDEVVLLKVVEQVINDNPQSIVDYQNGKDKVVGFLVGQVMKMTDGKANPAITNRLVIKELKGR